MIVYGDILFILNMTVDYLLLSLCEVIQKRKTTLFRRLLAAILGGISSFYIFLDVKSLLADIAFRAAVSFLLTFAAFGREKIFRSAAILLVLSLLQSGAVGFVSELFKLSAVFVSGTVIYADISPLFLIGFSFVFYLAVSLVFRITKNRIPIEFCTVRLRLRDRCSEFRALVDSGNSLSDPFSDSEIFIIDKGSFESFFNCTQDEAFEGENKTRFRLVPLKTVKGSGVLKGIRLDTAELKTEKLSIEVKKPLLALSEEQSFGDYGMIVPAGIFEGR